MEPSSHAFQFVRDVHVEVKIINGTGGIDKLRQDYYIKNTHTINIYYHRTKTIR